MLHHFCCSITFNKKGIMTNDIVSLPNGMNNSQEKHHNQSSLQVYYPFHHLPLYSTTPMFILSFLSQVCTISVEGRYVIYILRRILPNFDAKESSYHRLFQSSFDEHFIYFLLNHLLFLH